MDCYEHPVHCKGVLLEHLIAMAILQFPHGIDCDREIFVLVYFFTLFVAKQL